MFEGMKIMANFNDFKPQGSALTLVDEARGEAAASKCNRYMKDRDRKHSNRHDHEDQQAILNRITSTLSIPGLVETLPEPLPAIINRYGSDPFAILLGIHHPDLDWAGICAAPPRLPTKTDIKFYTPLCQVRNARNAFLVAEHIEKPLNTFITLTFNRDKALWTPGRSSAEKIAEIRELRLKALTDWCDNNDIEPLWVYSIENPPQGGHGPHMHILQHLPEGCWDELARSLHKSLLKSMGWTQAEFDAERLKKRNRRPTDEEIWLPFDIQGSHEAECKPLKGHERLTKLRYLCKSVNPLQLVTIDGITQTFEKHSGNTEITIKECGNPRTKKRVGTSRRLGVGARRDLGWKETDDLDWMHRQVWRRLCMREVLSSLPSISLSSQAGAQPEPVGSIELGSDAGALPELGECIDAAPDLSSVCLSECAAEGPTLRVARVKQPFIKPQKPGDVTICEDSLRLTTICRWLRDGEDQTTLPPLVGPGTRVGHERLGDMLFSIYHSDVCGMSFDDLVAKLSAQFNRDAS